MGMSKKKITKEKKEKEPSSPASSEAWGADWPSSSHANPGGAAAAAAPAADALDHSGGYTDDGWTPATAATWRSHGGYNPRT